MYGWHVSARMSGTTDSRPNVRHVLARSHGVSLHTRLRAEGQGYEAVPCNNVIMPCSAGRSC